MLMPKNRLQQNQPHPKIDSNNNVDQKQSQPFDVYQQLSQPSNFEAAKLLGRITSNVPVIS